MDDLNCAITAACNVIEDSRKDRVKVKHSVDELTIYQMHWSSDALMALQFFMGPDTSFQDFSHK